MKNKIIITVSIFISCLALGFGIWAKNSTPKVAYVKVAIILEKYKGLQEVRSKFQQKEADWKSSVDTLTYKFNVALAQYNQEMSKLDTEQRKSREIALQEQGMTLEKYRKSINEKADKEEDKMLQGALNQINSFIESYGKKANYTLIIGTTSAGNLLYGDEKIDITNEILEQLNKNYGK